MSRLWVRALQEVKLLHFRATPWIPDESSAMLVRTLDTFRHTILSLYALSVYLYRQYPRSGHCILSCTRIFNMLPQRQRSVIRRRQLSTTGERHITFLKSAIQLHAKVQCLTSVSATVISLKMDMPCVGKSCGWVRVSWIYWYSMSNSSQTPLLICWLAWHVEMGCFLYVFPAFWYFY